MTPIQYPDNIHSKFKFIAVAALRCRQLQKGARPRIASRSKKYTTVAQEEVLAGTVASYDGPVPEAQLETIESDMVDGPVSAE
ncbi:MAG TPA: DNA-directed RNA polymerase subunit omega [Candidatus Polarisedimenticolia bacterium]|jgi:DNA-directed RNA polymerase subunit K/omega